MNLTRQQALKILELTEPCTAKELKKAYYRVAKIYHPDNNSSNIEQFKLVKQAYEILNKEMTNVDNGKEYLYTHASILNIIKKQDTILHQ